MAPQHFLILDEESLSEADVAESQPGSRFGVRTLASALALAGCCAALTLVMRQGSGSAAAAATTRPAVGDVAATTQLQQFYGISGPMLSQSEMRMPPPAPTSVDKYFKEMMGTPGSAVAGPSSSGDAHSCFDGEELFEGLCYKTCKTLMNSVFPLRTSAWSCCQADKIQDCHFSNQKKDLGICSGHDVAGDGSCPHPPKKCEANEEMFLGRCYEKCSILTYGQKPYRTSAISCCETHLALSCFSPSHVSSGFAASSDEAAPYAAMQ